MSFNKSKESQSSPPRSSLLACDFLRKTILRVYLQWSFTAQDQSIPFKQYSHPKGDRIDRDHGPLSQVCPGGRLARLCSSTLVEGGCTATDILKDRFNKSIFYHPDASRSDTVGGAEVPDTNVSQASRRLFPSGRHRDNRWSPFWLSPPLKRQEWTLGDEAY